MPYCFLCYSADNLTYSNISNIPNIPNICKKCKIVELCDVCGLPCNNKCIEIFASCMSISDA